MNSVFPIVSLLLIFVPTLYKRIFSSPKSTPTINIKRDSNEKTRESGTGLHTVSSFDRLQEQLDSVLDRETEAISIEDKTRTLEEILNAKNMNNVITKTCNDNPEIMEGQKQAMLEFEEIYFNNRRFVHDSIRNDPEYFRKRSKNQTPKYLFIGCSDSRVPAEAITGLKPGELFVQRNIANLVVNTDINILSVIQYAVEVLKVKHVIVCGHYGCGGVERSMEHNDLGLIENWLRNIRDVYRIYQEELDAMDPEVRKRKLVEFNVREQCYNIYKVSFVQHAIKATGFPLIHGLVYELSEGILKKVNLDFNEYVRKYENIYDLN